MRFLFPFPYNPQIPRVAVGDAGVQRRFHRNFQSSFPSHFLGAERLVPALGVICLRMCFVYIPLAVNCAPRLASMRNSRSPHLSMNVTSFRSTTQARATSLRWFLFQYALNSCTQGSVSRPCRIHLSSAGVSLKLIFSMLCALKKRFRLWTRAHNRSSAIAGSEHVMLEGRADDCPKLHDQ